MDLTTILEFFGSPLGLSAFTILISEFIDKKWDLDGYPAFIRAAAIAVILCLLGLILHIGYMADAAGFTVVKNIIEVILLSAGAFNVPYLKEALEIIKVRKTVAPSTEEPQG